MPHSTSAPAATWRATSTRPPRFAALSAAASGEPAPGAAPGLRGRRDEQPCPVRRPAAAERGMVSLREKDVAGFRACEQLERAWEALLDRVDCPGVERVLGGSEIRELVAQRASERRRQ